MKASLKRMWRRLWKKRVNSPPSGHRLTDSPENAATEDDYLAEELVLRALASAKDADEGDVVQEFSRAATRTELSVHRRVIRLRLPLGVIYAHPHLWLQLPILRKELGSAFKSSDISSEQATLIRRCARLLNKIEIGADIPLPIRRSLRELARNCNWSRDQLRSALRTQTVKPAVAAGRIRLEKPSRFDVGFAILGVLSLVLPGTALAMNGLVHFTQCFTVDCVMVGSAYGAFLPVSVGVMPVRYFKTRSALYKTALQASSFVLPA